jgi:hypothetical protein
MDASHAPEPSKLMVYIGMSFFITSSLSTPAGVGGAISSMSWYTNQEVVQVSHPIIPEVSGGVSYPSEAALG